MSLHSSLFHAVMSCEAFLIAVFAAATLLAVPSLSAAAETRPEVSLGAYEMVAEDPTSVFPDGSALAGPCTMKGRHFAAALAGCAVGMFPILKAYKVPKKAARALGTGEKWGAAIDSFFLRGCVDVWVGLGRMRLRKRYPR